MNIKIGYSKNPSERLAQLCTATPDQLDLLLTVEGGIEREKELHRLFRDYHVVREWFAPSEQLIGFIEENMVMSKVEELNVIKKELIESSYHVIGYLYIFKDILNKLLMSDIKELKTIKNISILKSTLNLIEQFIENLSFFHKKDASDFIDDNYLFVLNKKIYFIVSSLLFIENILWEECNACGFEFNKPNRTDLENINAITTAISEELSDINDSLLLKSIKILNNNVKKFIEKEQEIINDSSITKKVIGTSNNLVPFKNAA